MMKNVQSLWYRKLQWGLTAATRSHCKNQITRQKLGHTAKTRVHRTNKAPNLTSRHHTAVQVTAWPFICKNKAVPTIIVITASDQEKIVALLASWSLHQKPTAECGNFSIEKVLFITKKQALKQFKCFEIVLKQTFCPKMAKSDQHCSKVDQSQSENGQNNPYLV